MDWLDKAINENDIGTISFLNMSTFDSLHSDPRYKVLLSKMKLEP